MSLGHFHSSSFDPTTTADEVTGLLPAQVAQRVSEAAVHQVRETVPKTRVQTISDTTPELAKSLINLTRIYIGPDAAAAANKTLHAYITSINDQYASQGKHVIWSSGWSFQDLSKGGVPRGYFTGSYRVASGTYALGWRDLKDGEDLNRYARVYTVNGTKTQDRWPVEGETLTGKTLVTIRSATTRYVYPGENTQGRTTTNYTYKAAQSGFVPKELPLTFQNTHWMTAKLSSDQNYMADRVAYDHLNTTLQFVTSGGCWLNGTGAVFGIAGELADGRIALALTKLSADGRAFNVTLDPMVLEGVPSGRVLRMVPISTNRSAILVDLYATEGFQYAVFFFKNLHAGNPVLLKSTILDLTPGPEADLTAADLCSLGGSAVWVVLRDRITGFAKTYSLTSPA